MKPSLFIGRWQPFHEGHKKLMQTVLDEGKNIVVGIRDTEISETDPYTVEEREKMIREAFPDETRVSIITVPDIAEIVYGRKVGYGIRCLQLDESTEAISGTEIRRQRAQSGSL